MDFALSATQRELKDGVERFCQQVIAPRARAVDQQGAILPETWGELGRLGILGLGFPSEFGGTEADAVSRCVAAEALSAACGSTSLSVGASRDLFGGTLLRHGTPAQKRRWLPPLIRGDAIGALALTEPGAGTDLAGIRTRATRAAAGWVLNGEKALITNAPNCDVCLVLAVTDPAAERHGLSLFLVDGNAPGVRRSAPYRKTGMRGSPTGSLVLDDCAVDHNALVGSEGAGLAAALQTLTAGRVGVACLSIGLARAALAAARSYAGERTAFGKPLSAQQAVSFKIADMHVDIDSARLMAWRAAVALEQGDPDARPLSSIAKLFATEMAVRVTDAALQIHGGWGYTEQFEVERLWRDARLGPLGEGTSEIQREILARGLLGF